MKTVMVMIFLAALTLAGADIRIKTVEKEFQRKEKKLRSREQICQMNGSRVNYRCVMDGEGKLIHGAWDDFFFGLSHGSVGNGSWSVWNFFKAFDAKNKNLLEVGPAEKVSLLQFDGGVVLGFAWKDLSLRMIQMNSAKEWIFLKVTSKVPLKNLRFYAYPGGAHWEAPGRERRLKTGDQDYDLTKKQVMIPFVQNGLVLYNRNYSEQNGNYLVYNAAQFTTLTGSSSGNDVTLSFTPKADVTEFTFALGYFMKEPPADAAARFLTERLPNIEAMLAKMNWDPKLDLSSMEENFRLTQSLLEKQNVSAGEKAKLKQEYQAIEEAFKKGKAANQPAECAAAYQRLEKFRAKFTQSALDALR